MSRKFVPRCPFCNSRVDEYDKDIYDDDKHYHELCWWKKECARLQGEIDRIRHVPTGSHSESLRPAIVHEPHDSKAGALK